jgi:glycosyltransferase involved in cell wall biosynthesis
MNATAMTAPALTAPVLRVAYVIVGLDVGGAETMLERLVLTLGPRVQPLVISLTSLGTIGPRLLARGVDVQALGMTRRQLPGPRTMWRLMQMLRQFKPDVVHTQMYHANLLGGLAARLAGVGAVMWNLHHCNLDASVNSRATLWTIALGARLSRVLPHRISSVAERARDVHVAAGYAAERFVVVPNGFDTSQFKPDTQARSGVRAELGLPPDTPLVGVIGRFDSQKNHRGFCEAMARLVQLRPGTHALLAGSGIDAQNAELAAWLQQHGVRAQCHLLGARGDVPRLMAALDVLMLPSLGEAFPNVVGEAMACGVPCAVTDVGDAALMVGEWGRVVAAGDMQGLGDAAASILALPAAQRLSLAQHVAHSTRQRFDLHVVAARYLSEYRSLLACEPSLQAG